MVKLMLRMNKKEFEELDVDTLNKFDDDYDKIMTEIEESILYPKEDPEKKKVRKLDASYFNMSPFRIVNNVPFKARELQW